jgi:tetratricopeptide (TPR) repeat protein
VELERFDEAIEPLRKADELWAKKPSEDRNIALRNWGSALVRQEQFEDATAKYALAVKIAPRSLEAIVDYGNIRAEIGRYRDALVELDKASSLAPDDPLPHNNKADFLFELGRYEDGWKEWRRAWQCYELKLKGEPWTAEQLEVAVYFADVLRDAFKFYDKSERFYLRVLERRADNAAACTGLAILYQQWANSDKTTPEIQARLNYQVPRAIEMLKSQLDKGSNFETLLSLVDLYIETSDWTEARECLARGDSVYSRYRLKRAEMTARLGLICLGSDEHDEAVKNFRQALLIKPGDLRLRSNLGTALLKLNQFEAAQDEFTRVLKLAPANIEALLGAAQKSSWPTMATRTNTKLPSNISTTP